MSGPRRRRASSAQVLAARRQRTRRRGMHVLGFCFLFAVLMLAAMPTVLVLVVGMVPSLVAMIVDVTPGRYAFRCVTALNIAGLSPSLYRLWTGGNDMTGAFAIVSDVYSWLAIYGTSALGWMLFLGLPGIVAAIMAFNATHRVARLKARQAELIAEWGRAMGADARAEKGEDDADDAEDEPAESDEERAAA